MFSGSRFVLFAAVLIASSALVEQTSAASWIECLKVKFYEKLTEGIINRSELVEKYKEAVETAAERYQKLLDDPKFTGPKDENLLLKLVSEEVYKLKERVKAGQDEEHASSDVFVQAELDAKNSACKYDEQFESEWSNWDHETDPSEKALEFDDEDKRLMAEVTKLDAELGLALDEQTKANLKSRTKEVLTDLLQNEAHQIAAAILSAYMTGGASAITILTPFLDTIKVKVVKFLIHVVIDVTSGVMGFKFELKPAVTGPEAVEAKPVSVAA